MFTEFIADVIHFIWPCRLEGSFDFSLNISEEVIREKVSVDFDHLLSILTFSSKYAPLILSTDVSYLDSPDDLTNTLIGFRTIFLDNMDTRNSAKFEPNFMSIPDSHTENN